jgi:hypothetical protein
MNRHTILAAVFLPLALTLASCSSSRPDEQAVKDAVEAPEGILGEPDSSATISEDESTARQWPTKFCSLDIGMTREQVREVMGEPTGWSRDQDANQDRYEAWGYNLTVFYDVDDRTTQIQPNSDNVPCETKFSN